MASRGHVGHIIEATAVNRRDKRHSAFRCLSTELSQATGARHELVNSLVVRLHNTAVAAACGRRLR